VKRRAGRRWNSVTAGSKISSTSTLSKEIGARSCTAPARRPYAARRNLCCSVSRPIRTPTADGRSTRGLADWPETLRGGAAEIYLRWDRELKPEVSTWRPGYSISRAAFLETSACSSSGENDRAKLGSYCEDTKGRAVS
jgi:hypothetical protein